MRSVSGSGDAFAHNFGLDLNSVFDPEFARQIEEKVDRRFGSVGVTQVPDGLSCFFQGARRLNSRLIEKRLRFPGIQVPESGCRVEQRRHTDASLYDGVVHFARQAGPLGQKKFVSGACLARVESKPAP